MRVQPYRSFSVAKLGNRPDENEDACRGSIPEPTDCRGRPAWLAIADGATEAAFSREWANLLVDRLVDHEPLDLNDPSPETLAAWLKPCRREWSERVRRRSVPWHGRAKVKAGAMATFLGVNLQADAEGELRWRAAAVGDCCLFVVREGCLRVAFPVADPDDFGNTPRLICSNPAAEVATGNIRTSEGICLRGDLIILTTDAVACWALTQHRQDRDPWSVLAGLCDGSDADRGLWVAERRADRSMRNDDATLLAVRIA